MSCILYSWLGAPYLESYDPESITIVRTLNLLNWDFEHQFLMSSDSEPPPEMELSKYPMIKCQKDGQEVILSGGVEIMNYLLASLDSEINNSKSDDLEKARKFEQWSQDTMKVSNTFFLLKEALNFNELTFSLLQRLGASFDHKEFNTARASMVSEIESHEISEKNYDNVLKLLHSQFQTLESELGGDGFLLGDKVYAVDLWLFGNFSLLLLPYNRDANQLKKQFPKTLNYLKRIHERTSSDKTGSLAYLN
ncbi:MAG: glutathione binding-like protein [Bdellovibrionales bacterium]